MLAASEESALALARFAELNPEFEEMRAGSRLVGAVERANDADEAGSGAHFLELGIQLGEASQSQIGRASCRERV